MQWSNDAIIKGYPYGTDTYVQLAEEELAALQPADDKTLLFERFFEPDQLDLILMSGRSLYLAPSLPAARQPFALLLAALRSTEKWALGRVVLSSNRQVVIVRPDEQTLVMHVLYFPAQQRAVVGIEPDGVELTRKDVAAMERIVRASNGQIPWDEYQDESQSRLSQLVQTKVAATSAAHKLAPAGWPWAVARPGLPQIRGHLRPYGSSSNPFASPTT